MRFVVLNSLFRWYLYVSSWLSWSHTNGPEPGEGSGLLGAGGCREPIPHAPVNLLFTDSRSSFLFISCQMQQQNNPREPPSAHFQIWVKALKVPNGTVWWHHCIIIRIQVDRFQACITHALSYYHNLDFSRSHGTSLAYISNTDVSKEAPLLHRQGHNKEHVHHTGLGPKWSKQIQYNEMT